MTQHSPAPIRALLVTNLFPSRREPTRGIFHLNGFRALSRYCEVRVLVPVRWWSRLRTPREWLRTPWEDWTGVRAAFPSYPAWPGAPRSHLGGMERSLTRLARRLRREFPFNAIFVAMAYPEGVVAARMADRFGCALVSNVLGSDVNELAARPELREEIAWGLRRADRVIALSRALRDRVEALGVEPERLRVQYNGVDGERFRLRERVDARQGLPLPPDKRLVLFVGNLAPEKGPQVLLEAFSRLKLPDVELVLVGGGQLDTSLRQRAHSLGLDSRVRFAGRQPFDRVPDWVAAADALCLPSFREGCPNVVLEALASGRPVAASAVGGVPELVDARNGALAPAGDADALARALETVLARPWDPAALRATVPFLSWDAYARALHDALQEAVAEKSSSGRAGSGEGGPPCGTP